MKSPPRSSWAVILVIAFCALVGSGVMWWRTSSAAELALQPSSTLADGKAQGPQAGGVKKIRFAMSAAFVSEAGVGVYQQIADYMTRKLGVQTEFVSGLAYSTINSMLEDGTMHCGFICGLPYVMLRDREKPAARLIAAPVMKAPRYNGQPKYFSDLIVRKDSSFQKLEDLRGKTYVYNDEISNSGYNLPRYRMVELGLTQGFFGKVIRSGSHEESIRMVAAGEADASFVDSLVLDYSREKGLGHAKDVKVIDSVGPSGICPLVASAQMPEDLFEKVQREFARMHEDPEGRKILEDALLSRFVIVDDSNYDDIRKMKDAAEKAGFTVIR